MQSSREGMWIFRAFPGSSRLVFSSAARHALACCRLGGRRVADRIARLMSSPEQIAIEAANLAFYRALESRDLSRMDLVWSHEEGVTCVHPGWHRLDGWSEVRRSWRITLRMACMAARGVRSSCEASAVNWRSR